MIYVECPDKTSSNKVSLFLGGGISGCTDWQKKAIEKLKDLDIVIYNPRRKKFDIDDENIGHEQITWEEAMMKKADVILFFFCRETLCPITLLELGVQLMTKKPIVIGIDPGYAKEFDVELQTKLKRPDVPVVQGLNNLIEKTVQIIKKLQ